MTSQPSPLARALGRIPTGLFIVTTGAAEAPMGFLGSFVTQLGFEPPTICVAVGKGREHLETMRSTGRFTVSVVDEASSGVVGAFFAKREPGGSPYDDLATSTTASGSIVLDECLAWLDCKVSGEHEIGDHVVVFGTVEEGHLAREADPKIHLRKDGLGY